MPIIKIHNVENDEIVEREMNSNELARWEAEKLEAQKQAQLAADISASKSLLLQKLGITEEEAKLLLS